jgi:hypothetical protein
MLSESSVDLYYTANADKGDWMQIATLEKVHCNPTCNFNSAFHSLPGEMLAIGERGSTFRVILSDGTVERGTLPFRHIASFYNNAKLTSRDRVSTDGGRSWQEVNTPHFYTNTQFDENGRAFSMGFDIDFGYNRPTIRQSKDDGKHWPQISQPPAFGVYVVGGASPVQYMQRGNNLWISLDSGVSWRPDHAAFEALVDKGGAK